MTAKNAVDWAERKMTGTGQENAPSAPLSLPEGSPTAPSASAPAAAPSGLMGMLTSALGITPRAAPAAGATGIPPQAPQGIQQVSQPIAPYQPETPPPLQMPAFDQLQFAGQQPIRLAAPPQVRFGRGFY
jgi:hypothetical protein